MVIVNHAKKGIVKKIKTFGLYLLSQGRSFPVKSK